MATARQPLANNPLRLFSSNGPPLAGRQPAPTHAKTPPYPAGSPQRRCWITRAILPCCLIWPPNAKPPARPLPAPVPAIGAFSAPSPIAPSPRCHRCATSQRRSAISSGLPARHGIGPSPMPAKTSIPPSPYYGYAHCFSPCKPRGRSTTSPPRPGQRPGRTTRRGGAVPGPDATILPPICRDWV